MKAASIDRQKALAVFADGVAHGARDVAVACNVHTRVAVWFLCAAERRGWLRRLPSVERVRNPDFGKFARAS